MNRKSLRGSLLLLLGSVIWGAAFVAQRVGMDHMGPFTFTGVRMLLAAVLVFCLIGTAAAAGVGLLDRRLQNGEDNPLVSDERVPGYLAEHVRGDVVLEGTVEGLHLIYTNLLAENRFLYLEVLAEREDGSVFAGLFLVPDRTRRDPFPGDGAGIRFYREAPAEDARVLFTPQAAARECRLFKTPCTRQRPSVRTSR